MEASSSAPVKPLRVLLASYRSHPQMGGQGVYVRELSRALTAIGHEVTVVSGPPYPDLMPDVRLVELTTENGSLGASEEIHAFGERLKAWLASRRSAFDVLHDNQNLFAALPFLDIPTVATLHHPITVDLAFALAAEPDPTRRAKLKREHAFLDIQAQVARALPVILTVSQASKARIVGDFGVDPARIRVAHCGVDHMVFRERPEIARDPNLVLSTVSNDIPHKGLVVLIEAMAEVVARCPGARLQVIGELRDGPAKEAIARLKLQNSVVHSGRMKPPQIADLYARAAVVVTPSLFEGFGLPAAEAMACGAAIVVTDGGALPEVAGDAGLEVPAGDAAALGRAIIQLLGDGALRADLGRRGAVRARTRFSWRDHALAATDAYLEAGAGNRPAA